jgi:2-aminoadipate transaminase
VSALAPARPSCLASWARASRPSALQTMLSRASGPGIISFALGLPSPALFPRDDLTQAAMVTLDSDPLALQYAPPLAQLREHVVELMAARGVSCRPQQVFLTAGAQQGMSLLARTLVEPGSRVIVERLTYTGFRQILEPFAPEVVEIPVDARDGMDLDALARVLATGRRPSLIYMMSHGHNPLGLTMREDAKRRLVALAARYGVPVMEDDAYGFLQYGREMSAPLRALDDEWICYVGSFSKILAPGLRQGWLVVPEAYIDALSIAKEATDINMATLTQRVLTTYLGTGKLPAHIDRLRVEYRTRRNVMLRMLAERLPAGSRWQMPDAGLFVWVELPSHVRADEVLRIAVEEEGVAFLPGSAFSSSGTDAANCMRLNFSHATLPLIEDGIGRLGRAIARAARCGMFVGAEV